MRLHFTVCLCAKLALPLLHATQASSKMPPAQTEISSTVNSTKCDQSVTEPKFRVRDARPEDCSDLYRLNYEFAVRENLHHKISITAEQLKFDAFGEGHPPRFFALVVEQLSQDGSSPVEMVGYSMYNEKYSTWKGRILWIEDIYIDSKYRKYGLGGAIMRKIASVAQKSGLDRIEWSVLVWNRNAIQFYEGVGGYDLTKAEDWHLYRFEATNYQKYLESPFKMSENIKIE